MKMIEKVQKFLNIPFLGKFKRKIMMQKEEKFVHTSFASPELACLYLQVIPIEGPLLIVPSLEKPGVFCDYKLSFFSNKILNIEELDGNKNPVVISEWTQYNSGGSHIFNQ